MTDYEQLLQEYKRAVNCLTQLYSDKTHFVDELIQNADDSRSRCMELRLGEKELFVWNDGNQFSKEDVSSICSIGLSNKDLTQIGTFGIGFIAVYNYTDLPEIYSGNKHFRIRDYRNREGIDNVDSEVAKQIDKGRTVFLLPFRDKLCSEDIVGLKARLCNLEERSLLFLRHLETVRWRDERDGQTGSYSCRRYPHDTIQNALQVELIASMNGNNQLSETFLIFRREVQPPQELIDEFLQQAEDDEEQHRIQRSAKQQQPVEVAFKLRDGRITAMDSCVLFAYLPTQRETHLRFLIQGRYQTTPARDNIPNDNPWTDNPWNKWLVQETATFLPEVLEQLKAGGLLDPAFFDVLPLETDRVPVEFAPIAEALRAAMKDRPFVPTQDGGYAKAENVRYPHAEALRKLVDSSWLHPDSSWLHPDIRRDTRCFKVMHDAGVREINVSQVLRWLEAQSQSRDWFADRSNEWLLSLYAYLNEQRSERERIKKLPLVRLENGKHVCASDQSAFLPPDTDEGREEISPFLNELPILMAALLKGKEDYDIEAFLKNLGVRVLTPEALIREWIIPQYSQSDNPKPSVEQNRLHLRYLCKVWHKVWYSVEISETPILWAYRGDQRETYDFVAPCNAYLPQSYTGDADLETYFSVYWDVWFVDNGYLESNSDREAWLRFLKKIGAKDVPRFRKEKPDWDDEGLTWRGIDRRTDITSSGEETLEEYYFHGMYPVLESGESNLIQSLWRLLIKALSEAENREILFQGTYIWRYRSNSRPNRESCNALFYLDLKSYWNWLLDEQGKSRYPSECFAPTPENRRVLGDSVAYLHPDFDISEDNEPARWLAGKLGVHLNADTDSVLKYLQTLSGTTVSIEDIEPLYRFLDRQDARPREKFKEESLIFTPNPEPSWWRSDQVFWVDERAVFGNLCGYLEEHYTETLKPFFIALEIPERASLFDYVRAIQEVTSTEQADDAEVRKRVNILYRSLWGELQKDNNLSENKTEWEQAREGRHWLGKKGSKWGFFSRHELVWNDHDHRAHLFEGKIPFWEFNDLLDLATRYLGIDGCSQAEVKFRPNGEQEKDESWSEKIQNLHPYIHAFLKSPRLSNQEYEEIRSIQVLDRLSVRLVEELKTTYTLKGVSISDPEPRPSFLDAIDQEVTLWLGLEASKDEYAELIGDALQDYFGIKELREFAEDLLTKNPERVLSRWKQRGLQTDFCTPPETFPEEEKEKPIAPIPEPNPDPPKPQPTPEPGPYPPKPQPSPYPSGGGESEEHRKLKEYLAANPSQLDKDLKWVKTEYIFESGDRVDILLEDRFGSPVTVEVETEISARNYDGVWQAVRYKHFAAAEYGLLCQQVRSIFAAPKIPDHVRMKCKQLGIEVREVTMPGLT